MNDQNQTDPNQPASSNPPTTSDQPVVPTFQTIDSTQTPPVNSSAQNTDTTVAQQNNNQENTNQTNEPSDPSNMTTVKPAKKFGGGKIIASILGFLVLVGGIAGGVILTQQEQDVREEALNNCDVCLRNASPDECADVCNKLPPTVPKPPPQDDDDGTDGDDGKVNPCVPNCKFGTSGTRECGDDGCGGSCGSCAADETCGGGGPGKCGIASTTGCTTTDAINGYCSPGPGAGKGCIGTDICNADQTCHCQGGVTCTFGVCVSTNTLTTACNGDGRVIAKNPINPSAKTCCELGYVAGPNGVGCVPGGKGTPPPGDKGTPPPITAQCLNVKAFNANFVQLTPTQLTQLKAGDKVRFTVGGQATGGSFQKARFTVNGTLRPEVTGKRPGTEEFFDEFTIPAGVTSFSISAQIFHSSLGWK